MKGKTFITLFFLCAFVPIALAKASLQFGWFAHGTTNKGQWLRDNIQLLSATENGEAPWRLVYLPPAECKQQCDLALHLLQQLYIGLGYKQKNIEPLIVAEQSPAQLKRYPTIHWCVASEVATSLDNHIVIVNQQGVALLQYPVVGDEAALRVLAKNIRTDVLKLMNYDRGGL